MASYQDDPSYGEMWKKLKEGNPDPGVRQGRGKLVKDGKWLVPRAILHEVVEHLHDFFHVGTEGVEKMLETLKAQIQSPKLVDIQPDDLEELHALRGEQAL